MKIGITALALLALAPAWSAADGAADPLRSPQCLAARAELQTQLAQGSAGDAALERARRATGRACLGASAADNARQRSGAPEPPQAVPPTAAVPRQPAPPLVIALPPPPVVPVPRPATITTCDPGGCWDSQGRRLNRMGPTLVGPGGACTGAGGVLNCP